MTVQTQGYWWLAYEWSNYLVACERCNSWKGALFPVAEDPRPSMPLDEAGARSFQDTPLLLSPFDSPAPYRRFRYTDLGEVVAAAGAREGFETIRTCGLDRPSLADARREIAERAHALSRQVGLSKSAGKLREHLRDLHRLGRIDRMFAGMVRSIFEEQCGMTWEELDALAVSGDLEDA